MNDIEKLAIQVARIEEGQKSIFKYIKDQKEHNENFYAVAKEVTQIKSSAKGAWAVFIFFGSLTTIVSGFVSWFTVKGFK